MNEIVTSEIARIAKEKGVSNVFGKGYTFIVNEETFWTRHKSMIDSDATNIIRDTNLTYHQLIDWIFVAQTNKNGIVRDCIGNTNMAKERLEFWYNILINNDFCPHCNNGFISKVDDYWQCESCDSTFLPKPIKSYPLKYEFKGRLLEWLRKQKFSLFCHPYKKEYFHYTIIKSGENITYNNSKLYGGIGLGEGIKFKTYEEAEHQGILEIFKRMKNYDK
jgi:ribosomal protein S27AE